MGSMIDLEKAVYRSDERVLLIGVDHSWSACGMNNVMANSASLFIFVLLLFFWPRNSTDAAYVGRQLRKLYAKALNSKVCYVPSCLKFLNRGIPTIIYIL